MGEKAHTGQFIQTKDRYAKRNPIFWNAKNPYSKIWLQHRLLYLYSFALLPSRLYCRFWNLTKSCVLLRSQTLLPIGNFTLPWRVLFFYKFIIAHTGKNAIGISMALCSK